MEAPFYDERSTISNVFFWVGTVAVGLYALAGVVIALIYTIKIHWQLIFLALMAFTILIPMVLIAIPWRKRTAEKSLKFTIFFLIIPLFFCGLSIFLSLNYDGDKCHACKPAEGICVPKTWACAKCSAGQYINYETFVTKQTFTCLTYKPNVTVSTTERTWVSI